LWQLGAYAENPKSRESHSHGNEADHTRTAPNVRIDAANIDDRPPPTNNG